MITNPLNRMDREQMIFQLMMNTKHNEEYLEKLPEDRLEELYRVKVEGLEK